MKAITNRSIIILLLFFTAYTSQAQTSKTQNSNTLNNTEMKTYLIEREIPEAGKLTAEQLRAISQKSCTVLKDMEGKIEWIQSYVTSNRIVCIYKAENEELIRQHAKKGGFPANNIIQISSVISPATAN